MKVFTVHEQETPAADRVDRAEHLTFVSDGFHWSAALFAPFMLLGARLWIGLATYVVALAAVCALLAALGASPAWITLAVIALHVIVGFEYSELERASLEAKGWSTVGTVVGRTRNECERRFFENWLPGQPMISGLRPHQVTAPLSVDLPAVAAPPPTKSRWRPW
ncbi:MAG: DUF2628 domain-containing protein [Hyphomicrobiaceae bacterium]